MPLLDVSELFGDPDFFDNYNVLRMVRTVDQHGRANDSGAIFTITANIQPATPEQVELIPEAMRLTTSTIICITQTKLVALTDTTAGDQIQYHGRNWRVMQVADWSEYGEGYYAAIAQQLELTQSGP